MPSLGVSSLDLGRLWERRRPLSFCPPRPCIARRDRRAPAPLNTPLPYGRQMIIRSLLRRGSVAIIALGHCLRQLGSGLGQIIGDSVEFLAFAKSALVHIERSAHLDLYRMAIICGIAVMLRDKSAGIGSI